jgi:hypothetical protein
VVLCSLNVPFPWSVVILISLLGQNSDFDGSEAVLHRECVLEQEFKHDSINRKLSLDLVLESCLRMEGTPNLTEGSP